MKNYKNINIYVCILLSIMLGSCEDFLEEDPKGLISSSNFWNNEGNAIGAVNGIYARPFQYSVSDFGWSFWFESAAQDFRHRLTERPFVNGTWNAAESWFATLWEQSYSSISRANFVLDNLPDATINEDLKGRLEGEARFLRAMHYFNLVRSFGDVPLVLEQTESGDDFNVSRTPTAQVYEAIINDLTLAAGLLPLKSAYGNATDVGRASKGAANGLLAKVYLTLQDWAKAKAYANSVIASGVYQLEPDYADIWTVGNDNGPEWIFAYQASGLEASHTNAIFGFPSNLDGIDGFSQGFGNLILSEDLVGIFSPDDERFQSTVWSYYVTNAGDTIAFDRGTGYFSKKYYDTEGNSNYRYTRINYPVLRYSDMFLTYAEAENEINPLSVEAFNKLNAVRNRAGLPNLTSADLPTQEAFRQEVLDERRREFFNENQFLWDLRRRDMFLEWVRQYPWSQHGDYTVLFPIPQAEIDANPNLEQNPGY